MTPDTLLLSLDEAAACQPQLVHVYRAAFGGPPHNRTEPEVARFAQALADHVQRIGFQCCIARESAGNVVGFAYGYTGHAGQWWYDCVARRLDDDRRRQWLGDCFEFMEFAVLPAVQNQGIGGRIHDAILRQVPHRTAVLSTPQIETLALKLYRKRGWVTLLDDFIFPGDTLPFLIMGLDLEQTPAGKHLETKNGPVV